MAFWSTRGATPALDGGGRTSTSRALPAGGLYAAKCLKSIDTFGIEGTGGADGSKSDGRLLNRAE